MITISTHLNVVFPILWQATMVSLILRWCSYDLRENMGVNRRIIKICNFIFLKAMGIIILMVAVGTIYWPSFTWSLNHWGITIQPVSALTLEMELTSLPS